MKKLNAISNLIAFLNHSMFKATILFSALLLAFTLRTKAQYNDFDWGTYVDSDYDPATGFTEEELIDGIAVDRKVSPEAIYVVGRTKSVTVTSQVACDTNSFYYGNGDAFLAKYWVDSNGSCGAIQWIQYFGNPQGSDYGYCLTLDHDSTSGKTYIYIGGDSKTLPNTDSIYNAFNCSSDACTAPVWQTYRHDEWDGWIAKYTDDGTLLRWTFLGGTKNNSQPAIDQVLSLTIDPVSHDVLATGYTESLNIGKGALNTYDSKYNNKGDAYIAVLDPCLSQLKFFSYYDINVNDTLNPTEQDRGHSIVIDNHRNIFISGTTESAGGIATNGTCQTKYKGATDAFVGKWAYSPGSNGGVMYTPIWGTYLGGKSTDRGRGLTIDNKGNSFVTGWTQSGTFPTSNYAFQKVIGGRNDAFITKLDSTGKCTWSTFFGGIGDEEDNGILYYQNPSVDTDRRVFIIGLTNSINLPLMNPLLLHLNGNANNANTKTDAFIAAVSDPTSSTQQQTLKYSTYLGGTRDETNQQALSYGPTMDFGPNKELYFAFSTKSANVGIISHADKIIVGYHTTSVPNTDAFVGKLIDSSNHAMGNCTSYPVRLSQTTQQNELNGGAIKYYPNPVTEQLHIQVKSDVGGNARIEIFDVLGRRVSAQSFEVNEGTNELNLNFNGMSPGMYLMRVNLGEESYSVNVIKQ